jgi:hypothetical protein
VGSSGNGRNPADFNLKPALTILFIIPSSAANDAVASAHRVQLILQNAALRLLP